MNLTGLHLLLTYRCNYQCDHCFVWSGPRAVQKHLTLDEIEEILRQAIRLRTVKTIYFEGGEPFLHPAILTQGIELASLFGFRTGIVSNCFWATDATQARQRLATLVDAGLDMADLSVDSMHGGEEGMRRAQNAVAAAKALDLSPGTISIERPENGQGYPSGQGGAVMFRGRAALCLADRVPHQPWQSYTACPHEKLADPARVHVDPFGNVHLCQGLLLGNLFEQPLHRLVADYQPKHHPIVGPLLERGPVGLVERYRLPHADGYADACHLCYTARQQLRGRFPKTLAPGHIYGEAAI